MSSDKQIEVGSRIKSQRKEKGLSQTELALAIGKSSPAYIAFIESGERNISTVDLIKIAENLNVSVSFLVGEKENNFIEALRSSTDISSKDREQIENFFKFIKNKND